MVGTSDEALAFIQEFTERRFRPKAVTPPPPPTPPKQKQSAAAAAVNSTSSITSSIPSTQSEGSFPSLPSNQEPYETMWPANISVHKKEDDYFAG
jgi:hypothetical protein